MTHPAVKKEYERAGAQLLANADDANENEFYSIILEGTERTSIDMIFRRVVRGKGEFLLFNSTSVGETIHGGKRTLPRNEVGRYDLPVFQKVFDPNSGEAQPIPRIARHEEVFEIPFSPQAVKDILAKDQFNTNTALILDLGHVRYSVRSRDDFVNLSTDDLMKKIEEYY